MLIYVEMLNLCVLIHSTGQNVLLSESGDFTVFSFIINSLLCSDTQCTSFDSQSHPTIWFLT